MSPDRTKPMSTDVKIEKNYIKLETYLNKYLEYFSGNIGFIFVHTLRHLFSYLLFIFVVYFPRKEEFPMRTSNWLQFDECLPGALLHKQGKELCLTYDNNNKLYC